MALTAFNNDFPKLYITAETATAAQFDQITLRHWHEEGFDIEYIPFGNGGSEYINVLKGLRVGLGMGESFGIVGMYFWILYFYLYIFHSLFVMLWEFVILTRDVVSSWIFFR